MNIDLDNMDHAINMINGFEALSLRDFDNLDAHYANTVLKLNDCDLNAIAGQEGFLSALKAGGKKLIEMIWNLLKKVKEFFFGSYGSKADKVVDEAAKASEHAAKSIAKAPDLPANILKNETSLAAPLRAVEKVVSKEKGVDIGFEKMIKNLRESAEVIRKATEEYHGQSRNRLIGMNDMLTKGFTTGLTDLIRLQLDIIINERSVDGKTLIQTTARANEVNQALKKLREGAKDYLAEATPVLEELTQAHDKALKATVKEGASDLTKVMIQGDQENALKYEPAMRAIARSIAIAVKLIQQCNDYMKETTKALVKIAALAMGEEGADDASIKALESLGRFVTT